MRSRAIRAGEVSYAASQRLGEVVEAIVGNRASAPSEEQLALLRRRYLEYRALEDDSRKLWSLADNASTFEDFRLVLKFLYRLAVFAAALVILWQWAFR